MGYYKDFNYVQFILSMDFESGFKLYRKGLESIKDKKYWDLYLVNVSNGYEYNFEQYKKDIQNKNLSDEDSYKKEDEIVNKINKIDNERFVKKKVM